MGKLSEDYSYQNFVVKGSLAGEQEQNSRHDYFSKKDGIPYRYSRICDRIKNILTETPSLLEKLTNQGKHPIFLVIHLNYNLIKEGDDYYQFALHDKTTTHDICHVANGIKNLTFKQHIEHVYKSSEGNDLLKNALEEYYSLNDIALLEKDFLNKPGIFFKATMKYQTDWFNEFDNFIHRTLPPLLDAKPNISSARKKRPMVYDAREEPAPFDPLNILNLKEKTLLDILSYKPEFPFNNKNIIDLNGNVINVQSGKANEEAFKNYFQDAKSEMKTISNNYCLD